jgi:hypothetical protein
MEHFPSFSGTEVAPIGRTCFLYNPPAALLANAGLTMNLDHPPGLSWLTNAGCPSSILGSGWSQSVGVLGIGTPGAEPIQRRIKSWSPSSIASSSSAISVCLFNNVSTNPSSWLSKLPASESLSPPLPHSCDSSRTRSSRLISSEAPTIHNEYDGNSTRPVVVTPAAATANWMMFQMPPPPPPPLHSRMKRGSLSLLFLCHCWPDN